MTLRSILKCKIKLRSMLVILMACMTFGARKSHAEVGKSGWPIFKKAQAANSRGVLSTFGMYGSLSGLFYNPAMVAGRDRREAYFFSESGMVGDTLGGLMYAEPLKNGAIAGGLVGYDAGNIELNWIENGELKTQNASAERDLLGTVSYGRRINNNLYAGASVKAATTQIAERNSANAFALDFGATYLTPKGFMFSAALQNLGTSTKFIEKSNPLPTSTYMGAGYAAKIKNYNLMAGVGATYNMVDQKMIPEVGAELRYQFISMNLGYRFADESVLTFGLGVNFRNIEVNYAYVPGIYLGTTHRVSVSYKFGGPSAAKQTAAAPAATSPALQAKPKSAVPAVTTAPAAKTAPAVKTAPALSAAPLTGTATKAPSAKTLKTGLQKAATTATTAQKAKTAAPAKAAAKKKAVKSTEEAAKAAGTTKTAG